MKHSLLLLPDLVQSAVSERSCSVVVFYIVWHNRDVIRDGFVF